ncbi:MAG TPA: hypothetical protein DCL45_08445, partial [Chloroflexi bacterium]|nr:hypothetical protein [Chloroflexota bacterium]
MPRNLDLRQLEKTEERALSCGVGPIWPDSAQIGTFSLVTVRFGISRRSEVAGRARVVAGPGATA